MSKGENQIKKEKEREQERSREISKEEEEGVSREEKIIQKYTASTIIM